MTWSATTVGGSPSWERGDVREWLEPWSAVGGYAGGAWVLVSLRGRLTDGNGYPKKLLQHGIAGLAGDGCVIAQHGYGAMAGTLQELDLPRLQIDEHERGVRRAKNLHVGKVALQDWDDALLRCGMQMRIDFVNDHDAWLFGQIRRIAVVSGVTDEHVRQPLQDRLCSLAKNIESNIPIERPKLGKQTIAVLGNTPELDGETVENLRGDRGYLRQQPAHGRIIAAHGTVCELDHALQDRFGADQGSIGG